MGQPTRESELSHKVVALPDQISNTALASLRALSELYQRIVVITKGL